MPCAVTASLGLPPARGEKEGGCHIVFRSLHMKLVLVLVLLIVSVMAVVGTFLINSVAG